MGEQSPLLGNAGDKVVGQDGGDMNITRPITSAVLSPSGHRFPQAIAHRGYKAAYPENSMGAFRGAVEAGAHALETDLHITKDEVVVLSHDPTLKRCFGLPDKVIDCDWKYLQTLETLQEPRQKLPSLKDLLEYLCTPGTENIWVLLDIKLDNDAEQIMRLIAKTIQQVPAPPSKPWNQRIVLGCWAAKFIPLSTKYLPGFPTTHIGFSLPYARHFLSDPALAHDPPTSFNLLQKVLVGPFGASFLKDIKNRKDPRDVFGWTVNERTWMKWSIEKGLDGVVTDDPKTFLEVCREWEEEEAKNRKAKLGWTDLRSVVWIHILVVVFGSLFRWRNPVLKEGLGKIPKEKKAKNGRIAI